MSNEEKTTSDCMMKIASHYLVNNCENCPFYEITETCDSKPINCTWLGLNIYFKNTESKEADNER